MRRTLPLLLVLLTALFGASQTVAYRLHTQDEIMGRLKMAAAKNPERQATLKKLFTEEACAGERLVEQAVKHEKLGNVLCTLPGATEEMILVTAHFDKVKAGMGVTDNWSGASMLPSLLYGLNEVTRKHTYIFIGFTGEEDRLVGSQFYASHLTKEQREKIKAVINMDTLGLGPTEVWVSHADPELVKSVGSVAKAIKANVVGMNVDNLGTTDSESFAKYNIPRMTLHSVTKDTWSVLHSDKDQISVIRPDDYYESYKLITVFLAYLDEKLGTTGAPASSPTQCP